MRSVGRGLRASFLSTTPVFIALCSGFAVIAISPSRLLDLGGLAIIGAVFIATDVPTLKRSLLGIILLEIPIQLDTNLGYDVLVADTNAMSGFNVSVTTLCLVALYGFWLIEAMAGTAQGRRGLPGAVMPAVVFAGLTAASIVVASNDVLALYEIALVAQATLILIYVAHSVRTRDDALFVVSLLLAGLALQSVIALGLQQLGSIRIGPLFARVRDGRVSGTIGSPNTFGSYLGLLLPLAFALVALPAARAYRWLIGLIFILGSVALVLTLTRGAWVGFVVSLAIVGIAAFRRGWVSGKWLAGGVALAALPAALQFGLVATRLGEYGNAAVTDRLSLVELAMAMIRDHPLTGVGANHFAASLNPYVTVDFSQAWISTVHNKYLLVWSELGVLALGAFIWLLVSAVRRGLLAARSEDPIVAAIALGLAAGIVGNMIHMTVDLFNSRPQIQMIWLIVGLLIALEAIARRSTRSRLAAERTS